MKFCQTQALEYCAPASSGLYQMRTEVPGGNSARTVIRLTEGQWGTAEVKVIRNDYGHQEGIEILFHGDWEHGELLDFFAKCRAAAQIAPYPECPAPSLETNEPF